MNRVSGGALCLLFALAAPAVAQPTSQPASQPTSQPASQPASQPDVEQPASGPDVEQPASRPVVKPVEVPKTTVETPTLTTPKGPGDNGEFTLAERPFPEEIHAKRFQFFQLDGYFRLRADRFVKPDLGLTLLNGGNPLLGIQGRPILGLPAPIELNPQNIGENFGADGRVYATSNLRLRLEPIFNVSEAVRVRAQVDVLDNIVLGSTPGFFPETGGLGQVDGDAPDIFGVGQVPVGDTIIAKRAWAEAQIPYGEIRFGRMGWHFGLGLFANDGNDIDSNFGDTVDRVALTFKLSDYLITGAFDFGATGVISEQPAAGALGQPFDISQVDDVKQYVVSAMRVYTRQEEEKMKKRGDLVLQYGVQGVYRSQQATSEFNVGVDDPNQIILADRRAFTGTLDVWSRLIWKNFYLEAEAVGVYGTLECVLNAPPGQDTGDCQDPNGGQAQLENIGILAGGMVVRGSYSLADGQWTIGAEVGAASADPQTSFSLALQAQNPFVPAQNGLLSAFLFDRDYRVDLILFRELLGTVTGAAYLKPSVTWRPLEQITLRGSGIYSVALAPLDNQLGLNPNTPFSGEAPLGLEFDLDAEYRTSDRFFAALSWGILVPQAGLNPVGNNGGLLNAETAQAFRLRLGVTF